MSARSGFYVKSESENFAPGRSSSKHHHSLSPRGHGSLTEQPLGQHTSDDEDEFIKIGNTLDDSSDPRKLRAFRSGNGLRMKYLKWVDQQQWYYTMMFLMFVDFGVELLSVSFSENREYETPFSKHSTFLSAGLMAIYVIDFGFRVAGLRSALLRSNSTVADLCCLITLGGLLAGRMLYPDIEFEIAIGYMIVLSCRLILKPRARTFSKKLHKFGKNNDSNIRIAMESVRASIRSIPGISALAIEMMETDLMIICGRDEGDMSTTELMQFLERALRYRPRELSSTDFLAYLQSIDAQSLNYAYGAFDVVRSTLWHWSGQKFDLFFSFVVVCVNALVAPIQSEVLGYIYDNAFDSSKEEYENAMFKGVMFILLLCVPFILGNFGIGYFQSKMIAKATEKMQRNLLDIILKQDTKFFHDRSEGDLNNLFSSDLARVNALWQSVFWNLLNPLVGVTLGFGFVLIKDWPTGVAAFAYTAALLSSGPQGFASKKSKDFGSKNAYVTAEFQNSIGCQKVIRTYEIRENVVQKFSRHLHKLRGFAYLKDFWSSIVQIYVESAMYIFVAVQTAALAMKVRRGELKQGEFVALLTLLGRISTPVTVLGGFMRVAIGNASSLQRVDDVIIGLGGKHNPSYDKKSKENKDNKSGDEGGNNRKHSGAAVSLEPSLPKLKNELALENIFFRYSLDDEQYILSGLSMSIPRGAYTCLCGPSGSGKSTVLSLLMQFYHPESGEILLDGYQVGQYSKRSFMEQTAVVFQEITILNGTILENIRYGNLQATDIECREAAKLAECHFIEGLQDGFDTIVGQHATCNLSGGQAQRICLARALCRRPRLLLLDEATSALDPETEASIVHTFEKLSKKLHMTIVSVTHRLKTTQNADVIFVLKDGKVAEKGTYRSLSTDSSSLFSEMINCQDNTSPNNAEGGRMSNLSFTNAPTASTAVPTSALVSSNGAIMTPQSMQGHRGRSTSRDADVDTSVVLRQFTQKLNRRLGSTLADDLRRNSRASGAHYAPTESTIEDEEGGSVRRSNTFNVLSKGSSNRNNLQGNGSRQNAHRPPAGRAHIGRSPRAPETPETPPRPRTTPDQRFSNASADSSVSSEYLVL